MRTRTITASWLLAVLAWTFLIRRIWQTIWVIFINLESISAPVVGSRVQSAHLAGEVAFETTDAEEQTSQRQQKSYVERHQKMSGGHEQCADDNGASAPEQAVGE